MQRYKLVIGGTIAGIAGVLAFPTRGSHLTIPTAGSGNAATGGSSGSSGASASSTGTSAGSSGGSAASSGGSAAAAGGSAAASGGSAGSSGGSAATRSATSADQAFRFGDMAVKVTVSGSKITGVSMATLNETDGRSVAIDSYAVPQLEQQVISAGSVNINGVSGATFTSQAFVDAVANALTKLGIKA
ncbi:MAG TPA: FMN-binding protein [Acidimicrobiales bacterium]|nr:FMN-binding protein [Acidimicrobiales bacterium]